MTLPCIVCRKALESAAPDEEQVNQPSGGTCFQTYGHYGSTFWDLPYDRSRLEVNICDECLRKAEVDKLIMRYRKDDQLVGEIYDSKAFVEEASKAFTKRYGKP